MGQDFWFAAGSAMITSFVGIYIYYAYTVFVTWEKELARTRVTRRAKTSPSNANPPGVSPWEVNKELILAAADEHLENFQGCELLHILAEMKEPLEGANATMLKRSARSSSFSCRAKPSLRVSELVRKTNSRISAVLGFAGSLSKEEAKCLDMDHIYIPYGHFLWALTFIGPMAMFLWIKGITFLMIRKWLHKKGLIKPKPFDPAEIVARLCLEGTMGLQYYAISHDKKTAGFFYPNFPTVRRDGAFRCFDLLYMEIDLEEKKLVQAKLDDQNLTASEALTLTWFNTIAMNHVKMHALANWGVNMEPEEWQHDKFVARSSLVTVIYNYFGYKVFGTLFATWCSMGVVDGDFSRALTQCFDVGVESGIWSHPQIRDLVKHSRFFNFLAKARVIFMAEFDKHRGSFPGIHGEALFVGTVMHSLDHTIMDRNLADPLWLDIDHPEFGAMAQIGQIVKVGFVSDVPFLYFHHRFKGSGHPFYDSVYEKCAKVDKDLADNMDTCIIK